MPVCQCTDVCVIPQGQPQPVASCRGLERQATPPAPSDLRERVEQLILSFCQQRYDETGEYAITTDHQIILIPLLVEFATAIRAEAKAEGWEEAIRLLYDWGNPSGAEMLAANRASPAGREG